MSDRPATTARGIERQYYAAMAMPFLMDVIVAATFSAIVGLMDLFLVNLALSALVLGIGVQGPARHLFRPVRRFLAGEAEFASIERTLTQLPIRSAVVVMWAYMPILLFRMIGPLVFGYTLSGAPTATWTDAILTVVVQLLFAFVFVYFLVSGYLERLCHFLFIDRGVNLGLFFGRFSLKIAVALVFTALAPLVLIAGEIFSYDGERLAREVAIDLTIAALVLPVTLFWVSRTLSRPLARLDAGMGEVAKGDLRVRLPVTSNEEIGELTSHFNAMVEGLHERQRIRETFGKYVSESVAAALLRETSDGRLTGETREATVMFTDIEGFTSLSERLAPDVLIAILNEYLEVVVAPIERHGGVVNGFIGDGLFASFNMPLANHDHAACAIAAATEIQAALAGHAFAGGVRLTTRIGINSGTVIGGTIGAGARLSYTLLGDAVNTASRLQELNKVHGTGILISEATRLLAGDRHPCRLIGEVAIRGRKGGLLVHTPVAASGQAAATARIAGE